MSTRATGSGHRRGTGIYVPRFCAVRGNVLCSATRLAPLIGARCCLWPLGVRGASEARPLGGGGSTQAHAADGLLPVGVEQGSLPAAVQVGCPWTRRAAHLALGLCLAAGDCHPGSSLHLVAAGGWVPGRHRGTHTVWLRRGGPPVGCQVSQSRPDVWAGALHSCACCAVWRNLCTCHSPGHAPPGLCSPSRTPFLKCSRD